MKWSKVARVLEALGLKASQESGDESVSDLMSALHQALRRDEPAFESVVEVFLDTSSVVYAASPEGSIEFFIRDYSMNDGEVKLGQKRVAVEPRTTFVPLSENDACECQEPCACGAGEDDTGDDAPGEPTKQEVAQMDKLKKLAARIIGCEASPFKEGDEEQLVAFGEERLAEMADGLETSGVSDVSTIDGDEQDGAPDANAGSNDDSGSDDGDTERVTVSQAEYNEMKEALAERRAAIQSRQKSLAAKIAGKTDVYQEVDLRTRPVEELEQLAKALKCDEPVRDYSGKGAPVHEDDDSVPPPPSQTAYARALRAGKNRQEAMEEARQAATTH